jgi:hypothetical protein
MYRGHKLLEVARHVTCYGESSSSNQSIQIKFDRPSWRKLHFLNERFRETDLYTQSRYHDTLNYKYPSVEAYTKVLEVVLIGDIKPKYTMKTFKFDEVRPKLVASKFKPRHGYRKPPPKRMPSKGTWGDDDSIWDREGKCGLYHIYSVS